MRSVRTYLAVPGAVAALAPILTRAVAPLLTARLQRLLESRIDASSVGPGAERRDQPWWVLARVRAAGRRGNQVTVSGYDSYGITGVICALGAQWLLEGRAKRAGVLTTAQALEPREFLNALAPYGVGWRLDPL